MNDRAGKPFPYTVKPPTHFKRGESSTLERDIHGEDPSNCESTLRPAVSQKSGRSEDECRLLGSNVNEVDPEAVPIKIPTSRAKQGSMPQIVSGGPQPTNTLKYTPHQSSSIFTAYKAPSRNTPGKSNTLITRSTLGTTVQRPSVRRPSSPIHDDEHPPKRLKTALHRGSVIACDLNESESDDIDELGADLISLDAPVPTENQVSAFSKSGLSSQKKRHGIFLGNSNEHLTLEKLMNSGKYVQQSFSRNTRGRPNKNLTVTSQLQRRDSTSSTIDLTGIEDSTPRYPGTARKSTTVLNGARTAETEMQGPSKYFSNEMLRNGALLKSISSQTDGLPSDHHAHTKSSNLRDKVSTDSNRRISEIGISSDELGVEDDYESVERLSPPKMLRSKIQNLQASEQSRSISPSIVAMGIESSNIKATQFTDSANKHFAREPYTKRQKPHRPSDVDGFNVSTIIVGNTFVETLNKNMAVVFNDSTKSLDVHHDGVNLSDIKPTFKMRLQKLIKVQWSHDCRIVRLEFSRSPPEPSQTLIELTNVREMTIFMRSLLVKASDVKDVKKEKSYMEKLFDKVSLETSPNHQPSNDDVVDDYTELGLMQRRKEERDAKFSGIQLPAQLGASRASSNRSVVEKLLGSKDHLQSWTRRTRNTTQEELYAKDPVPLRSHLTIDRILSGLKEKNLDTHLTRSKSGLGVSVARVSEAASLAEEFPDELRYSKQYGLGKRWRTPLVYPMVGKKKTTVEFDDLERLDDGQFLNDNLIGFYLRYLECTLETEKPHLAKKVYWFNTYFFASLTQTQTGKGKRGINYDAVRKWTRTVDIFGYDYAIVPINESAHWYVAIICNLGALHRAPDFGGDDAPSSPPSESLEDLDKTADGPREEELLSVKDEPSNTGEGINGVAEISENEDTRESFAEMHLVEKNVEVTMEQVNQNANDDDLVSTELSHVDMAEFGSLASLLGQSLQTEPKKDVASVAEAASQPISVAQRRGKRKSIPPPRVFDPLQPAIITLDSLDLAHSPTIRVLKDYLHEEAKDKRGMDWEDSQIKGITVKQIPLQDNYCDCGLFLLGYMAKFCENPEGFVTRVLQRQHDKIRDFPNLNPSTMRSELRKLAQRLHSEQQANAIGSKKQGAVKAGNQPQRQEQILGAITDQTSPFTTLAEEGKHDVRTDRSPTMAAASPPSTRWAAVQSGPGIEDLIPISATSSLTPERTTQVAENSSSTITEPPLIVLDSQEHAGRKSAPESSEELDGQSSNVDSAELPMEIPNTPPPSVSHGSS